MPVSMRIPAKTNSSLSPGNFFYRAGFTAIVAQTYNLCEGNFQGTEPVWQAPRRMVMVIL